MMYRRSEKGFTLVELLVTMALMTICIIGLASVNVMAIKSNSFSRMSTRATVLAKDKIESLKNVDYDTLASGGPETVETVFSRQWTVAADTPVSGMKTVVVDVSWPVNGLTRTVSMKSIIGR